jgi:uncharacterized protein (DUF342 family)
MDANDQNSKNYASIHFSVGDEVLVATPKPNQEQQPLTEAIIKERLNESGFGAHSLTGQQVAQLIELSELNAHEPLALEPHRDASAEINISPDQLKLVIDFTPAEFGEAINYEELYNSLLEMALPESNINQDKLKKLITSEVATSEIIAQGLQPVHGDDAYFEVLFHGDSEKGPELAEDGKVDHYETHDYVTVNENTPLMRLHPATKGSPGMTIFDEVIQPEPGNELKFNLNPTVHIDSNDSNLLVASKSGHPIVTDNSVIIDETLTLDEASLETGNVHFDGSVLIKGEVKPNVVIEASGDIHVKGLVESARLIAGKNITIEAGVVSSHLFEDDDHEEFEFSCKIKAGHDINIRYCNSIYAEAGGSIYIQNYSMHSCLKAHENIIAGIDNGKGVLLGGEIHAEQQIEANIVGSDAYVRTNLYCVNSKLNKRQCLKSENRLNRIKQEVTMLSDVLERIKSSGTPSSVGELTLEKAKRIHQEIRALKAEYKQEKSTLAELKGQVQNASVQKIQINKKIFPNTLIFVANAQTKTAHTHSMCSIVANNGEIEFRDP